ncbi:thioredoxin family protein [Thiohalobacter thiocyanaticus]|uniref:Thioredoxin n=1 Tax=Thiohalobacter thiocyanaticus TaxID=585455 RepID=A0A426QHG4_9GAMM|nr:thioredoxin fold domain-containing protein [Thiohalobacter thiocyanaticus]RRQ21205.1 thioredoxin [Thiohalobacter thiocyanaticus]
MMHKYWYRILSLTAALLLLPGLSGARELRDPGEYFFDQTFGDFSEELQLARDEGKTGILMFFEMDECPFCHRMKEMVLNRAAVQDYYREHFLIFPVDIEGDIQIKDFDGREMAMKDFAFEEHRVRATPVFVFFNLEGEPVARYTGATRDAEEFMWLGEYVVDGVYREMPFTRYKRERRSEARGG